MNIKKYKINLIFFLFALGLIVSFITVEVFFVSKNNLERALHNGVNTGKKREAEFLKFLSSSDELLHSIRASQSFNQYLDNNKNRSQLQELLLILVNSQKNIMQLRYIDANGLEQVRIDRTRDKKVHTIKKDSLQNKLHRYYFQDSMKKPLNKVWFSALDLNIENKQVEVPDVPTLRAVLPIEDEGVFSGIIIVNYFMESFLTDMFAISSFDMILLNNKGEILKHYNPDYNWSSYKENSIDIYTLYPQQANDILSKETFQNNEFVSVKFHTPIINELILLLKLKEEHLSSKLKTEIYHILLIGLIVLLMSVVVSLLITRLLKVLLVDLDETKKLNTELQDTTYTLNEVQREVNQYIELVNKHVITSTTNIRGKITYVSQAFCHISGYTKEELIGKTHSIVRHPDSDTYIFKEMWDVISNNTSWQGELKNMKKDGGFYWVDIHIHPIYDSLGVKTGYTAIRHDITNKKLLETIAITDALTGIYNRRYFDEMFTKCVNVSKRKKEVICFMMMDIDYFKQYNDTYGHQMGDDVLKKVASAIRVSLRRADDYCFRLGGEEFGILFRPKNEGEVQEFANYIKDSIENLQIEHSKNTASQYITISIGLVSRHAHKIESVEAVYKEADKYLYKAKENGRNQIFSNN